MVPISTSGAGDARRLLVGLQRVFHRLQLGRRLAVGLTLAVIASGFATYAALTSGGPLGTSNVHTVLGLLVLDLVLILLLAALVARRLVQVWVERRSGAAGAKLHVRLVVMFSLVAVIPAIVVAVFSALLIETGIEQWFNARVSTALQESLAVANAYLQEHQQVIGGDALAMANDLNREGVGVMRDPALLERVLAAQAGARALSEAVVFDSQGEVLARAGLAYTLELSIGQIPKWAFERARNGDVAVLTDPGDERVRALVALGGTPDSELFLYVGRYVDAKVIDHVARTNQVVAQYEQLQGTRSGLEITFTVIYAVVALLLLLGAVWVGLAFANQLARPIVGLIDAAERVRGGDLSARVEERPEEAADELGFLSRAFNRMTSQLAAQRTELVDTNRELDERRRFSEAVLAGVSAGVIGLDGAGRIELPNRSAADLLGMEPAAMIGRDLADLVPEMAALVEAARRRPERAAQDEIKLQRDGRTRVLLVRVVAEYGENEATGFVVTFDDVTDLLAAQRQAAWADVARRIAHEIKNPLTPIQLSAERLKRKYLQQIGSDRETFISCTDTIVRQVGDIGRMVDEFSSFARMPAPSMRDEDCREIARQAVFLARHGYSGIAFETELPSRPVPLSCDARQIGQALTNLIKNAVEAVEGRDEPHRDKGRVVVRVAADADKVTISVEDNGRGLPLDQRDRLAEPYVTTRAKGTGLGLAIVKKIMEDHRGDLVLEDLNGAGARASLVFRRAAPQTANPPAGTDAVLTHGA